MTFLSFNLCVLSILGKATLIILKALHVGGLDKDTANLLSSIDAGQALSLFMACAGLYWSRRVGATKVDSKPDEPAS
jgi:hypothetical protein